MKLTLDRELSLEEISSALTSRFPEYQVSIGKNPLLGFQFVLIKQSAFKGAYVRVKGNTVTIDGAIPEAWARFILIFTGAWLFLLIFQSQAANQIGKPVSDYINDVFIQKKEKVSGYQTSSNPINNQMYETENTDQAPAYLKIASVVGILLFTYLFFEGIYYATMYGINGVGIFNMALKLTAIVSFVMLMKQNKKGFFLFAGVYGIRLIISLAVYGTFAFYGIGIFFFIVETILLILFAINLKNLK